MQLSRTIRQTKAQGVATKKVGIPSGLHGRRPARQGAVGAVFRLQSAHGNRVVQRLLEHGRFPDANENLNEQIQRASGGGSALESPSRTHLESGLGADLSAVRVHTDLEADRLCRAVGAVAFTSGQNIFFRDGKHQPETPVGVHLLAHEAAHTVQQATGRVDGSPGPGGILLSNPSDPFERAANEAADQVLEQSEKGSDHAPGHLPFGGQSPVAGSQWGVVQRFTWEDETGRSGTDGSGEEQSSMPGEAAIAGGEVEMPAAQAVETRSEPAIEPSHPFSAAREELPAGRQLLVESDSLPNSGIDSNEQGGQSISEVAAGEVDSQSVKESFSNATTEERKED